ncbi:serine/threonine-protein kinase pim-1-like [Xenia sp. Carnegie-2017]|uniref:serine/threonine-protein kinase pim-1-like n=1 Tax=Xenia sp. Carnegie-2017 TaxID=2897299 RepID=UPI001F0333E5|nr:serine/threonine-protein kinase pim-1-like [Xenia sp. Carnegie-2017]
MNENWNYIHKLSKKIKKSTTGKVANAAKKKQSKNAEDSTYPNLAQIWTPESVIQEYDVIANISTGGNATIYSANRRCDGTSVALKVVEKCKLRLVEENGKEIPVEVSLHRRVKHNNIIQLLDYFECGPSLILVLERPEAHMDLFDYISKQEFLTEKIAKRIFRQVLDATLHCEEKGVFHRDIKDENIILDLKNKVAKLADFGSGTQLHNFQYTEYEGTRSHCPPEWFTNQRYLARPATIWSLGILLYDMVSGDVPFANESEIKDMEPCFNMALSQDVISLITTMLNKDPRRRATLEDILNHQWLKDSNTKLD